VLDALEHDAGRAAALRSHVETLLSTRRLVGFFADSGVLPLTGFFTELGRIVTDHLLPPLPDEQDLRGVVRQVFHERDDWRWLQGLPPELSARLWWVVLRDADGAGLALRHARDQMLEAVLVLGYRIGGLDVAAEFGTLGAEFAGFAARFRGLAGSAQRFVDSQRGNAPEDNKDLQVLAAQCSEVLQRAHRTALRRGTSLRMTYTLRRTEQSLQRLLDLAQLVDVARDAAQSAHIGVRMQMLQRWSALMHEALAAESQRRSLSTHVYGGLSMLALRVTDNAAKTGEHYIADTRAAYFGMWRSAMGAGLIIGAMALLKVFAGKVEASLAGHALMYSLIYGLGFVVIYMLHLTVATKQPAMTAQTIAGYLGQAQKGRVADLDRVVDLVAGVVRSQFAAILGNVVVALPTAIVLFLAWGALLASRRSTQPRARRCWPTWTSAAGPSCTPRWRACSSSWPA
jgi:site-specific recombinase